MRCNPRYWIHIANKRLPIIHPNAWYRITWDVFVLLLVLYNAILVPYQVRCVALADASWQGILQGCMDLGGGAHVCCLLLMHVLLAPGLFSVTLGACVYTYKFKQRHS